MDIKALGQLGERAFTAHGGEGGLGLENAGVIAARTFRHRELLGGGRTCRPPEPACPRILAVQKTETTSHPSIYFL